MLMRDDGFGSTGNMIIVSGGFFLASSPPTSRATICTNCTWQSWSDWPARSSALALLMTLLKAMIARFLSD